MTGERTEVVLPVRVRQEADVHHDVGVERQTVLEAEALDGDLQPRIAWRVEGADDPLLELVHVEVGRVDHEIGGTAQGVERSPAPVSIDSTRPSASFGQRVEAAGGVVPTDELRRRCIEEEHAHVVPGGAQFADLG